MSPPPSADRSLVFGLLALQMNFVTREQLLDAMLAWLLDKQTPLGDILCRRGVLADDEREVLDLAMEKHVKRHGGDPQASLAALRVEPEVREDLRRLEDAQAQGIIATLPHVLPAPVALAAKTVAARRGDGLKVGGAGGTDGVRYRRLRKHARGGLGEVFVALDEELQREVALKQIQDRFADHPDAQARFLREAEVTGKLEHPGVVPVYGLGADADGRPFYAMRFIRGESMQQAIQRFHKADEDPSRDPGERSLTLRDLLGRFVAVCNAVAYAHSKGVLHRDLKPENAMLGEFGETLVVDWGLARLVDQPDSEQTAVELPVLTRAGSGPAPTEMGRVVGTPAFMPPEQANGRLDEMGRCSDVFSLGATLYCLLTGQAPYQGTDALAQAARAEVEPARQRKRSVPPALEAICVKAMAAKPEERYATARALAQDVQRWLADEPVSAYREPWLARAGRWLRRHKTLASSTAAALLVALVLGGFGAWRLEQQAARQRQAVETAMAEVARLQQQARWAEARVALDGAEDRLGEGGAEDLRVRLEQARRDLDLVARLDAIRLKKATWVKDSFDWAGADSSYEDAFREAGMVEVGGDAGKAVAWVRDSAVRDVLVAALDDWAVCAEKRERRGWLLEVARRADPHPWRDLVRDPAAWEDSAALARLAGGKAVAEQPPPFLGALGTRFMVLGGDAEGLLRVAQERHPADFWCNFNLGYALNARKKPEEAIGFYRAALALRQGTFAVHNNLGNALRAKGNLDEAISEYRKAITLDSRIAIAHNNLGNVLRVKGNLDEAIAEYRKTIELDPRLALARYNLGIALGAKGNLDEAIVEYRKTIELDSRFAIVHTTLGNALRDKGKLDEAIAEYRKAIELDPRDALAHTTLGNALRDKGKLDEAIAEFRKAIALDSRFAAAHANLGVALRDKGKVDEAIAEHRKASELDPRDARTHTNLGVALGDKGMMDEAIAEFRKAIEIDPRFALAHHNLGIALRDKVDEAIAEFRKAIALDPRLALAHFTLGNALGAKGNLDEAIREYRQAITLDPRFAPAHSNLGNALYAKGKVDEAISEHRKAIALDPNDARFHGALGQALLHQGQFAQARQATQQSLELLPANHPLRQFAAEQLRQCEQMLTLDKKLTAILKGEARSANAAEQVSLARLCKLKKRWAAGCRFYADAFVAQPTLADDLQAAHRYNAACAAALAGCGQGTDDPRPDEPQRARLRQQALGWLRADLVLWSKQAEKDTPEARAAVLKKLQHWKKDTDLAGVRDAAALEKLPEAERAEWRKLWAEVDALAKR